MTPNDNDPAPAPRPDGQGREPLPRGQARQDSQQAVHEQRRQRVRPYVIVGLVVLVLCAIAGGGWYWWSTRNQETSDDAFTDGRAISIAPHVTGYVTSLDITDNEFVHQGQALIHIDPRDDIAARDRARGALMLARGQMDGAQQEAAIARENFPARLAAAQAQQASAEANLFKAQTDDARQIRLPRGATTQQDVDTAQAALRMAQAQLAQAAVREAEPVEQNIAQADSQVSQLDGQVRQAEAELAQAELNLSWCVVVGPSDGWVTKRAVERGNYVQQGQQIMDIVAPDLWVTANFKETELNRMRPGQRVRIAVDAYPGPKLLGHVDSVQLGTGSKFSAFPPENATGNFVKIVQRVPVKIDIDSGLDPNLPLPLGASVEPTVLLK